MILHGDSNFIVIFYMWKDEITSSFNDLHVRGKIYTFMLYITCSFKKLHELVLAYMQLVLVLPASVILHGSMYSDYMLACTQKFTCIMSGRI